MNRTSADATRTQAVLPLSTAAVSAAQAGADAASTAVATAGNSKARRQRAATTLWRMTSAPGFCRRRALRIYLLNFRASSMASQCAIGSFAHQRSNRSQAPLCAESIVRDSIEEALKNIGGGCAVDDFSAAAARQIAFDHAALDRGGGQPLVPERQRQVDEREQVLGELPDALDPRRRLAVEAQWQADDDAANAVFFHFADDALGIVAEARAADGVERRGDDAPRVAQGQADGLGADIQSEQPCPRLEQHLEVGRVADRHVGW